jgi:inorganic pyrophosphatase
MLFNWEVIADNLIYLDQAEIGPPLQRVGIALVSEINGLPKSASFWDYLDRLFASGSVVIDRPGNSPHPCYPEIVYPLDYGYLEGTTAIDGGGLDIWQGGSGTHELTSVVVTVALLKRDAEIKILLGCTEAEMQTILNFHNTKRMRALLIRRTTI